MRLAAGLLILCAAALIVTHLKPEGRMSFRLDASRAAFRQDERMNVPWPEGAIDPNTGDAQELEQLNGVGPAIAQRIIEERETNGAFLFPEDLLNVSGIGQKTLNKLWSQLSLPKPDHQ